VNENRLYELLAELTTNFKVFSGVTSEKLERYNELLEIHIKRTELLEKDMQTALLPIRSLKWVGGALVGLAAVYGAFKALLIM